MEKSHQKTIDFCLLSQNFLWRREHFAWSWFIFNQLFLLKSNHFFRSNDGGLETFTFYVEFHPTFTFFYSLFPWPIWTDGHHVGTWGINRFPAQSLRRFSSKLENVRPSSPFFVEICFDFDNFKIYLWRPLWTEKWQQWYQNLKMAFLCQKALPQPSSARSTIFSESAWKNASFDV